MFKKTVGHDFTILLVKDSLGHVFGVYLTDKIRNRSRYTGDADSFVFTFHDGEELDVYVSTGANQNF